MKNLVQGFPFCLHLPSTAVLVSLLFILKISKEKYDEAKKQKKTKKNKGRKREEYKESRWGKKSKRSQSPDEEVLVGGASGSKDNPLAPTFAAPATVRSSPGKENPSLGFDSDEEFAKLHMYGKVAKQEFRVKMEQIKLDLADKIASFPDVSP